MNSVRQIVDKVNEQYTTFSAEKKRFEKLPKFSSLQDATSFQEKLTGLLGRIDSLQTDLLSLKGKKLNYEHLIWLEAMDQILQNDQEEIQSNNKIVQTAMKTLIPKKPRVPSFELQSHHLSN